ncbi:MAG: hypothetical protein ACLQJR_08495 [Stellaceae bacterium]
MTVHEILRQAIIAKRCVRVRTSGFARDICPHALGFKRGSPRVLAFQYGGSSVSGLAPGGQWRAFFVHDIEEASLIEGRWRSGHNFVAKVEACLDRVEYSVSATP